MRILIVDDHELFRQGVAHVLRRDPSTLLDEAATGNEAIDRCRQIRYDAVILDLSMPDRSGLDVLKQIRAEQPSLPILILSMHAEDIYATRAFRAGAAGYMTKDVAAEQLPAAIRKIVAGGRYVSSSFAEKLAFDLAGQRADLPHQLLSDRELQVLLAVVQGHPPREIASRLGISVKTVATHRIRILQKMQMRSTTELIHYAVEHSLI